MALRNILEASVRDMTVLAQTRGKITDTSNTGGAQKEGTTRDVSTTVTQTRAEVVEDEMMMMARRAEGKNMIAATRHPKREDTFLIMRKKKRKECLVVVVESARTIIAVTRTGPETATDTRGI